MALPFDIKDIVKSGAQVNEERERPVRIAIYVEVDAPDDLVASVERHFHAHTANARVAVEVASAEVRLTVDPTVDAIVAVVGSGGAGISQQLVEPRERAIPVVAIGLGDSAEDVADVIRHPYRDTLARTDAEDLVTDALGEWLVERLSTKRLAMAHNFAFMRKAVALEAVKNTAWQNGAIGVVAVIPGADMPLMTANQAKMLLQIAAAYGQTIGVERLRELAAVVGGGFVLRTLARQGAALVPGFGWAIKGSIGASGTLAMGYAAINYFENGGKLEGVRTSLADSVKTRLARRKSGRSGTATPALPGQAPSTAEAIASRPEQLPLASPAASLPAVPADPAAQESTAADA